MSRPEDIPQDVWDKAEEAFDLMLCNCIEASGTTEQFRIDSIEPHARAILAEREECITLACKVINGARGSGGNDLRSARARVEAAIRTREVE